MTVPDKTMLLGPDEEQVVIAAGHSGLTLFDTARHQADVVLRLGFADRLVAGSAGHFAVVWWPEKAADNTWTKAGAIITAHSFQQPATVLSTVHVSEQGPPRFGAEGEPWKYLPSLYALEVPGDHWDPWIVRLGDSPRRWALTREQFDRLDDPEWGIQVTEGPDDRRVIVQGAHAGGPAIVWDVAEERAVGGFPVGGYPGIFRFRSNAHELWSAHYDTIDRIDVESWRVIGGARIKNHGFIRDMTFDHSGERCAVTVAPHGHSIGTVLAIDCASFAITHQASFYAGSPDSVVLLSGNRVVVHSGGDEERINVLSLEPAHVRFVAPRDPEDNVWL